MIAVLLAAGHVTRSEPSKLDVASADTSDCTACIDMATDFKAKEGASFDAAKVLCNDTHFGTPNSYYHCALDHFTRITIPELLGDCAGIGLTDHECVGCLQCVKKATLSEADEYMARTPTEMCSAMLAVDCTMDKDAVIAKRIELKSDSRMLGKRTCG